MGRGELGTPSVVGPMGGYREATETIKGRRVEGRKPSLRPRRRLGESRRRGPQIIRRQAVPPSIEKEYGKRRELCRLQRPREVAGFGTLQHSGRRGVANSHAHTEHGVVLDHWTGLESECDRTPVEPGHRKFFFAHRAIDKCLMGDLGERLAHGRRELGRGSATELNGVEAEQRKSRTRRKCHHPGSIEQNLGFGAIAEECCHAAVG